MYGALQVDLKTKLEQIRQDGLYKHERVIATPQDALIAVKNGKEVLNFCANNYLGLSNDPAVRAAAAQAMEEWGYGLSSVRFICGTQEPHKQLEAAMSRFLGTEDSILFGSCFDANGAVFEPLLDADCAIITDSLNHASIIDGIRLCKAERFIFEHNNFADLETKLQAAAGQRLRLVVSDGVFSMDGDIADLKAICDLAEKYQALVMVDDSHASGFIGKTGRGTPEHCGVMGRVDIITTTFGKALGGASGGCISGHKEIIEYLRQKARPYLFSNSLMPAIVGGTLQTLAMLTESTALRDKLERNTKRFREGMNKVGLDVRPGTHPICPVMLYDEKLAHAMADKLLEEGIYVIGFSFPVVPRGKARIRVQISAGHSETQIDQAIAAFGKVGKELGALK
ncbi:MAG: glycine C-acetyltransferase [Spirochaetes bacterium GWD1_61_31]|nr:MAG: glycine C-acetyltransferase [Spirochaetes bacterium GWB1_60_80]OHD34905.1 MAG: glycine C-acetyltransferase [Spirochaetes bacterium GWC1_61_12]OHD37066.1 MAG: glycine C-acetyltransferase [Spirochaetes bacterium GWD1_61_31]OHD44669.1 MAG: glycine C-acetyltransferase [Spirochaetes bacterium GWE1_60_18]OHD61076.1 MAG: glycine C-acetyltransferase [Spirochaetes bacterium GWF1_60_12]HAP42736.1 glycine C-acetyltransferase [Spirochaetaceae bacterium]